ncbi:MAG: hypothetical protein AAGD00_00440 [Planctomycetota bacterium]
MSFPWSVSRFGGVAYFQSGPHRFRFGRGGQVFSFPENEPGGVHDFLSFGAQPLTVFQEGRLIDTTRAGVTAQLQAIRDRAATGIVGALTDLQGVTYTDMQILRLDTEVFFDRGRAWSVGYALMYRKAP